jgi:acetyl esterase/lipase
MATVGSYTDDRISKVRSNFAALLRNRDKETSSLLQQSDIVFVDHHVTTKDGYDLLLRWYTRKATVFQTEAVDLNPAVLYLHGGGGVSGSVEIYDGIVSSYVSATGVPFLSVDYRLAPENPFPAPLEDCYQALEWLHASSSLLAIDPRRISVMGDSAGGGLAAALSLLARDRKLVPALSNQILVYPMLDNECAKEEGLEEHSTVSYQVIRETWDAYLGDHRACPEGVSQFAAAARLTDATNLPETYIEVGEWDAFCAECIEFARRLRLASVNIELHVYPEAAHGFDVFTPAAVPSATAMQNRVRRLCSL